MSGENGLTVVTAEMTGGHGVAVEEISDQGEFKRSTDFQPRPVPPVAEDDPFDVSSS